MFVGRKRKNVSGDQLLGVIEAIHDAGVDATRWPHALDATARLVGAVGATVEVIDRDRGAHDLFYSRGLPKLLDIGYLSHYAAMSPRIATALRRKPGEMLWDYLALDEAGIARSPFYAEFLTRFDMRYFVGGVLKTPPSKFGGLTVQHSIRHGHADQTEIALLKRLVPHASQALKVARCLGLEIGTRRSIEEALDWLKDGVALVDALGRVSYSNQAFEAIVAANDGIGIKDGRMKFSDASAGRRFAAAWSALLMLRAGNPDGGGSDFSVARASGAPAYLISVRPLSAGLADLGKSGRALAVVLARDPLRGGRTTLNLLREAFGFTPAEAGLARALQDGMAVSEYARSARISLNTVYTHLRRLKEKTGCHRLASLIRLLNATQASPLRDPMPERDARR